MRIIPRQGSSDDLPDKEPTNAELAAIEREMPLIEAELDLLDAEIAVVMGRRSACALDRRRLRRAERRVLTVSRELAAQGATRVTHRAVAS
jgi:hypothetical protein